MPSRITAAVELVTGESQVRVAIVHAESLGRTYSHYCYKCLETLLLRCVELRAIRPQDSNGQCSRTYQDARR